MQNQLPTVKIWSIISLFSGLLFAITAFSLMTNQAWLQQFDHTLIAKIRPVGVPRETTLFWIKLMTALGSIKVIAPLVLLLGSYLIFVKKNSVIALWLIVNIVLGSGVLNFIVKQIFKRPRPVMQHFVAESGWSFPSGHSMGSMVFYLSLAFILIYFTRNKISQILIALIGAFIIISIGISRVYLGVHFPSDILGGFSLGLAWMAFAIAWFKQRVKRLS